MRLESLMGSRAAVGLAVGAGRTVPPRAADWLGRGIARIAAGRQDTALVRAVRLNQWVASGRTMSAEELDDAVLAILQHAVRVQYALYRNYRDPSGLLEMVDVEDSMLEVVERSHGAEGGTIIVGPHVGSFDIGLHSIGHLGFEGQVLSVPDPGGGYQMQNEQRARSGSGLDLTPMSKDALVQAVARLEAGGCVGTGLDRPYPGRVKPHFFGEPAELPVAHVRLALRTGAAVYLVAALRQPNGRYRVFADGPIHLETTGDREGDTLAGAERLLRRAEQIILEDPLQWLMFYPVWPDLLDDVP